MENKNDSVPSASAPVETKNTKKRIFNNKFNNKRNKEVIAEGGKDKRNFKNQNLQVMFFGGVGLDGIGGNMTAFRFGDEIIVVDCGVGFPDESAPGVDLVIPDMSWLKQNAHLIKAVLITHAHEDHIGALPYSLDAVHAPVYGSKWTLSFVEAKLKEHNLKFKGVTMRAGDVVRVSNNFTVECIHVNHSTPDSFAFAITTPAGLVLHSGDFKIDYTPLAEETTNLSRFGELGQKGVDLFLCESTNVEREGFGLSEKVVAKNLAQVVKDNPTKRITITGFVSNIYRTQRMMDIAKRNGRKVAFAGRSMIKSLELAMKIGLVNFDKDSIIDLDKVKNYADNEVMILATGSQGQQETALYRMASHSDSSGIALGANDLVIFSSSPVPGNEKAVTNLINKIIRCGSDIVTNDSVKVHASGHACRDEIALLHKLVKPKFFMPIHGEPKHQKSHKELVMSLGMKPERVIIPEIGNVVELNKNLFRRAAFDVPAGLKFVDGVSLGEEDSIVLRDRKVLAEDGMCIVVMTVDQKTGTITNGPEIIPRGFAYGNEIAHLTEEGKKAVAQALSNPSIFKEDWQVVKGVIRKALTSLFFKKTKRKPLIIPIVIDND